MARTRTEARGSDAESQARRNPSRSSRIANSQPARQPKRPRTNPQDDDSSDGGNGSENSFDIASSDTEGEIDSSSDVQFEPNPRQKPTRASSRISIARRENCRRSARQAELVSPQKQSLGPIGQPKLPAPRNRKARRSQRQAKGTSGTPNKRRKTLSLEPEPAVSRGVIPDWRNPMIPYGAWADIFYYAATTGGPDSLDVNWLIGAATTCKAFSEPALTAIYRSPPITTAGKARRLVALLERPPSETRLNYRVKVESLYLDIAIVPQAILYNLIQPLCRLKELVFYTQYDQPPYRQLDRTVRWHYSEDIFRALLAASSESSSSEGKAYHTFLKSWEWSGRLLGGPVATIDDIVRIHREPYFSQLTKVSFTNMQVPSLRKLRPKPGDEGAELQLYHEDGAVITAVAEAISQLSSLRHLVFESSTVMNDRLLPLLPKDLHHLSLINCWEVKSEDFTPFLHSHGRALRSLNLSHNQSLNMAFLTDLADACPNLEELRMNLSYFRHHMSVSLVNNDADPLYDQALLPDQVPRWPQSIRVIDLEHVRHWSVEAAEMFLQSLIDNAASLPNLRHLALKTMLNIPWKARANMRHEWRTKLDKVFLRPFQPPKKVSSLRQVEEPSTLKTKEKQSSPAEKSPSRRSGRLATQASDTEIRQGGGTSKGLRSLRGRPLYKDPDTDEDEFDDEVENDEEDQAGHATTNDGMDDNEDDDYNPPVIQGRCTTVSIIFDNQKPTELQYGMEDFMDDDRSESDEEWDGDEEEDDTVFVWR